MSGHSKWATIKHKKAATDAKRGKLFTRVIRELTIAARLGGSDPDGNPRLRTAIADAKAANMPKDTMDRAVKKGAGELDGEQFEEVTYEGYGPGGVAFMIDAMTDNTNRTTPEIRHIFEKYGGSFGAPGSVRFQFEQKGYLNVEKAAVDEDKLMEVVLDAGADDLETYDEEVFTVYTTAEAFEGVRAAIEAAGIPTIESKVGWLPNVTVNVADEAHAKQTLKLAELFDDHDDVQNVWTNFDIPDELMDLLG